MKARVILFYLLFLSITAFCQSSTIDLTFTAVNNTTHIQMDSIKIMNRTQGGDTVLYWPDTVLSLYFTDIPEHEQQASGFIVFQNYPNPVTDLTTISIYLPEKDEVTMTVMDLLGRLMYKTEKVLDKGSHSFRFSPGNDNLYFFTGHWRGNTSSIKILHAPTNSNSILSMEYLGSINSNPQLKLMEETQDFNYAFGDELLYIAYIDTLESGFSDSPEESQTYTFQFATNIPCPGTPVITYEGKTYNTIQIFSQCWLKENLDVGTMIPKDQWMEDNGIIERYCYNDDIDSCEKYGGLYQWDEMMLYTLQEGVKGICPVGWHIPTDKEWQLLEGAVDSQYGIGDNVWIYSGDRGLDAGNNLKTNSGWVENGNGNDMFGFEGLPGGCRVYNGISYFSGLHYTSYWWTSTKLYDASYLRYFSYDKTSVHRISWFREYGFSVRCLRDE